MPAVRSTRAGPVYSGYSQPTPERSGYLFAQVRWLTRRPWPGSSVGTSVRLKIGRSAVRPRPWPLSEPQVIALVTCGFVRLGVRSPMTANGRETPGLTASCPELGHELGHGYRCGASLMRSGVGTSWSAGHDVYRPAAERRRRRKCSAGTLCAWRRKGMGLGHRARSISSTTAALSTGYPLSHLPVKATPRPRQSPRLVVRRGSGRWRRGRLGVRGRG